MEGQKKTAQEFFDEVAKVVAENFVAVYEKRDMTLSIRSVGGVEYRLTMEQV